MSNLLAPVFLLETRKGSLLRKALFRYVFAVVAVLLTFGIRLWLIPLTGAGAPFVLFFAVVLIVSLYGGVGPGLLAIALDIPLAGYMFVIHAGYSVSQAVFQSALFAIDGLVVVYLTSLANNSRRNLEEANDRLRDANEEIQRSAAHARDIIDLAPDAFFLTEKDGRISDSNRAACEMLGCDREDLIGTKFADLLSPEDASRMPVPAPGAVHRAEWTIRRKDGNVLPVEASAKFLPRGRWQAFVRDIAERKRGEAAAEAATERLRESEERCRLMIDEAPIGKGLVTPDGRFVRVNRALCELLGYSADELTARTVRDITHPDDYDVDLELSGRLARGEIPRYHLGKRYLRKDGAVVDAELHTSVLRSRDGAPWYFVGQIEDVTERKKSEQALQRAVAARDQVLSVVAHDLRNPLNIVVMQASAMERRPPDPERRNPKPREVLLRAAGRMNRLIQDLLDVSLLEAGALTLKESRLCPASLVAEAVETQKALASSQHLKVHADIGAEMSEISGDHDRLMQVLENLIGNAIKFTHKGGSITVGAAPRDHEILFRVTDSGCGIAAEDVPHVFDRFWRAAEGDRQGSGLGLPIAKGIVEAHGGHVWVETEPGHGSTFFFSIPSAN